MLGALLDKVFNRPLDEHGFARKMIEAARSAGYREPLDYLPDEFRLRHGDGAYFNLHNAFRDYRNAERPKQSAVLEGYVATLLRSRDKAARSLDEVRPLLRPVIRNLAMLEEVRLHHLRSEAGGAGYEVIHRSLGKDCVILLAIDHPESTSTLTKGPEPGWGLSMDDALGIARDNLRASTPEAFEEIVPGLYIGRWNDGYDVSRALLPDVLQRAPIKGQPVFMIPTNDVLLVAGDHDPAALRQMVELSFKAQENGRPVSSQIFTYQDQRVVAFKSSDDMLLARLATLDHLLLQGAYHAQKELLDKLHEARSEDLFVASYMLYELADSGGRTFSMCSWTQTVNSLLPRTDRVALVELGPDGVSNTRLVAWAELESKAGGLLEQVSLYPPRYRTLGFPLPEQLGQMAVLG
ncbi:DUF1444 family protein [Pseudomonas putida]|uniref:DUF1444 family protein n=1 Tax=Pseudomonas putida TaxID=303 RepID=A0A1Q9QZA0_PSEPU|nr:DUF1444 family protein [Pseudomonas putida]OLS60457.1 hypothetical protein PSEMO_48680 [Pseudomonas putida]